MKRNSLLLRNALKASILGLGIIFGFSNTAEAQAYNFTTTQICNATTGGSSTITFPATPTGAITDATLTILASGDIDISGTEYLNYIGEGATNLGQSPNATQCTGVSTFTTTIPLADVIAWASTGNSIDIIAQATTSVNSLGGCVNGATNAFCVTATLSYDVATGPNDAGISEIISPTFFCLNDSADLIVRLNNYGTNQLDSCQVTWDVNGTSTTSWFVVNLDTINGTGNIDTVLNLGPLTLNGPMSISVSTSLPNNVVDTVTANDMVIYDGAPSLAGTYSLGSSVGADFSSFNEFVDSLNMVGVCGPVIVEVENGTYSEAITLIEATNMSATNNVTFRGANLDNTLDTLTNNNGDPTITMDGGDYYAFEHITLENTNGSDYVVLFNDGSDDNRFENCYIRSNDSTSTSTIDALIYSASATLNHNNKFYNNTFKNGSYAFYWWGTGTTSQEVGNEFVGNEFVDQYYWGAYIY